MSAGHRCRRCGASCEGLRVRPDPDERAGLDLRAAALGLTPWASGPWVRQVWGRCVFLDAAGCRLHARFGPEGKPRACRTFPSLPGGEVDPACFHDGAMGREGDGRALDALGDLEHGRRARAALDALPLVAVLDGPDLGPTATDALRGLLAGSPARPALGDLGRLAARIEVAVRHGRVPYAEDAARGWLAGGAQLAAGAGLPTDRSFAAWVRLVATGVLPSVSP